MLQYLLFAVFINKYQQYNKLLCKWQIKKLHALCKKLLSTSALSILSICCPRMACGNLRNSCSHVILHVDQSPSFYIFHSAFYLKLYAILHFTKRCECIPELYSEALLNMCVYDKVVSQEFWASLKNYCWCLLSALRSICQHVSPRVLSWWMLISSSTLLSFWCINCKMM